MAKRAKAGDTESGHGVSALRGNGYDSEQVQAFVERIENLQDEIDEVMAQAKEDCEPHRADIKAVKDEAHDAGIPKREFNAIIAKRRALRRAEAFRRKLDEEQQNNFDQLEKSLGMLADTPLGKAVLSGNGTHTASYGASA